MPVAVTISVWFTDGEMIAKVDVGLPVGSVPTEELAVQCIAGASETLKDQGLRLCTPQEFGEAYLYEKTGQHLAVPGPNKWDIPELEALSNTIKG